MVKSDTPSNLRFAWKLHYHVPNLMVEKSWELLTRYHKYRETPSCRSSRAAVSPSRTSRKQDPEEPWISERTCCSFPADPLDLSQTLQLVQLSKSWCVSNREISLPSAEPRCGIVQMGGEVLFPAGLRLQVRGAVSTSKSATDSAVWITRSPRISTD